MTKIILAKDDHSCAICDEILNYEDEENTGDDSYSNGDCAMMNAEGVFSLLQVERIYTNMLRRWQIDEGNGCYCREGN